MLDLPQLMTSISRAFLRIPGTVVTYVRERVWWWEKLMVEGGRKAAVCGRESVRVEEHHQGHYLF